MPLETTDAMMFILSPLLGLTHDLAFRMVSYIRDHVVFPGGIK